MHIAFHTPPPEPKEIKLWKTERATHPSTLPHFHTGKSKPPARHVTLARRALAKSTF
jgi:hypothetical protein